MLDIIVKVAHLLLLKLMFVFAMLAVCYSGTVYVQSPESGPCPSPGTDSCHSLNYYAQDTSKYWSSGTDVKFLTGAHTLDANITVTVENVTDITLMSINCSLSTTVFCSNSSGFVFQGVTNLKMKCLTFKDCSSVSKLEECNNLPVGLLFASNRNIHLFNVTVENSTGYGVCGQNNSGVFVSKNSVFQYNIGNINNHGGNLQLFYKQCPIESTMITFTSTQFLHGQGVKAFSSGSGLSLLLMCESSSLSVTIQNCTFNNNSAPVDNGSGGNIFLLLQSLNHQVTIVNSTIENGVSDRGGGMFISINLKPSLTLGLYGRSEYITVTNSIFLGNRAGSRGGAVSLNYHEYVADEHLPNITEKHVIFNQCIFSQNTVNPSSPAGTAIDTINIRTLQYLMKPSPQLNLILKDCNISENNFDPTNTSSLALYPCGQVYFTQHPQVTINGCRIVNSDCSAIMADHSTLIFYGQVELSNNTGLRGGGLYFADDSVMYLTPHTQVNILGNTAEYGGGIYIEQSSECFLEGLECFYQFDSDIQKNQSLLTTTHVKLTGNKAYTSGDAVFGGTIEKCYFLTNFGTQFRKKSSVIFSQIFSITQCPTCISSRPYGICFCSNIKSVVMYPGQTLSVPVVVVGQKSGRVPGNVVTETEDGVSLSELQKFQTVSNTSCTNLQYTVYSNKTNTYLTLAANAWCNSQHMFRTEIDITFKKCPIGFVMASFPRSSCECVSSQSLSCNLDHEIITRRPPHWLGYDEQNLEENIIWFHCPLDYCKTEAVNMSTSPHSLDQDVQCAHNRTGILCGGCHNGTSAVFGSSKCLVCSNKNLLLLVVFAFAGLLLVLVIITLNLTVSLGTINGLLFYVNVVQVLKSFFFPPPVINMPVLYQFISWFNLDLGMETCFYDGMDTYSKTWLQWAFPLYLFCITAMITMVARRSALLMRLVGRNATSVLATLLLLSYTKLVRNTIIVFDYSQLHYHINASLWRTVWTMDGNILFWSTKHTAMVVVGMIALLITLPYLVVLFCVQCLRRVNHRACCWVSRLKPLTDAYTGVYKDSFAFWTGHLLLLRAAISIVAALEPVTSPITILSFVVGVCIHLLITSIWVFRGVYRGWYLDVLESSYVLNLCCLSATTAVLILRKNVTFQEWVTYVSISIAFTTFIGVVLYHLHLRLKAFMQYQELIEIFRRRLTKKEEIEPLLSVSREVYDTT